VSDIDAMLDRLRGYRMSRWEKRAQAIDWAAGNVLVDRPERDEWMLRLWAAKAYDEPSDERPERGEWQEPVDSAETGR
jgi:hypothetical protein